MESSEKSRHRNDRRRPANEPFKQSGQPAGEQAKWQAQQSISEDNRARSRSASSQYDAADQQCCSIRRHELQQELHAQLPLTSLFATSKEPIRPSSPIPM